jgi:hypothetical protein
MKHCLIMKNGYASYLNLIKFAKLNQPQYYVRDFSE